MSRHVSPSTNRPYGLLRVTQLWRTARATVYRQRRHDVPPPRRRPGPVGPMPDDDLVAAIRDLLAESPFHGEGYRKIWARLRFAGIRTSKRRVLRLMREHGLLAPGRVGRPHGPRAHDGTIRTERVDEMWGTDLTSTLTGEGQASIFVTVDHGSTECLGLHAARRATRFEALEPLRQGVRAAFGAFAEGDHFRSNPAPRPRQPVRRRRLPEGARLPRHRKLAGLRARAPRATAASNASSGS
jgi:hypothetical protein